MGRTEAPEDDVVTNDEDRHVGDANYLGGSWSAHRDEIFDNDSRAGSVAGLNGACCVTERTIAFARFQMRWFSGRRVLV